jgi:hypothetical protein
MPVAGRKPKPEGQRRNHHKPTHDWVEVPNVPFEGGPKLPRRKGGWPAFTKRWWETVSAMPHCVLWAPADWQFALDTALIAAEFHEGGVRVATELRQREKVLGTTMDARRDLRIRYVEVQGEVDDPGVTRLDDYRDL